MNRHKTDNTGGCIIYLFLVLALAISIMFLSGDADAQGVEPAFWYRCDCLTCWYLDLQGNDVPVVWGTWLADYSIWGIYLDCQGSQYPDCQSCWSIHDARRWQ